MLVPVTRRSPVPDPGRGGSTPLPRAVPRARRHRVWRSRPRRGLQSNSPPGERIPDHPWVEADPHGTMTRLDRPCSGWEGRRHRRGGLISRVPRRRAASACSHARSHASSRVLAVSTNPVHPVRAPDHPDRIDRPLDAERPLFHRPSLATEPDGRLVAASAGRSMASGSSRRRDGTEAIPLGPRCLDIDGNDDLESVGRPLVKTPTSSRIPCMIPQEPDSNAISGRKKSSAAWRVARNTRRRIEPIMAAKSHRPCTSPTPVRQIPRRPRLEPVGELAERGDDVGQRVLRGRDDATP